MINPIAAKQLLDAFENYVKTLIQEHSAKSGSVTLSARTEIARNKLLHRKALHDAVHALYPISVEPEPIVGEAPTPIHKPPGAAM